MKRREFVINTSLASVGGLSLLRCKAAEASERDDIGLQLYTVRDDMDRDPKGTLKAIADMGYTHVENAGYKEGKYYGMNQGDYMSILNDLDLKMYSGHTQTGAHAPEETHTMINQWEKACEDAAKIKQENIVLAYIHDFERTSLDDYKKLAELCNKCGETAKSFGVQLAYHNHDFEFHEIENTIPYDILLSEVDADLMKYELDLYWTRKAGVEALDYFNKYPNRFPLWHIKDMEDGGDQFFTEVGNGVIDWKKYFAAQTLSGMQHFYVEQDHCKNHKPLESVKISVDYLNTLNA